MEQLLREREQYFQKLIEHGTDIIAVLDAQGVIRYVSPSVLALGGYAPDDLVGRNMVELLHPDDVETLVGVFFEGVATGVGGRFLQLRFLHKDGSYRTLEAVGRYLLEDPVVRGVVINARDVTERRSLERQLLQAQKLEAVGRLAGGIAHDFNNLLTAILASTDLLLETLPAYHPARDDALETRKAALRAADLTRQLLAFSRQQVLTPRVLHLNGVVEDIAKLLKRLLGEDIDLRTTLAPDLGAVRADPGQLEQVIMNLAVNARDAMPEGGKLTIETANVSLDETYVAAHTVVVPGPYVMIAMSDTGVGMDDATRARVFEPFFTTKPKGKGTGLGLATVYGIVKQSGGYIWVYSEPGHGATFKIYFPRVDDRLDPADRPTPVEASPRGSETVLLCEDQDEVRSLTHRILVAHGYDVLVAGSGAEALELVEAWPHAIDLLLTDVVMPGMSGRDLARQLAPKYPAMKVLYLSGYPDESIVRHGVLEPGVAFLQKPFTAEILARKLREVLDG
ncbi:MAG: ATP-binding protein [Gemmatimonadales bacterium]